MPAGCARILVKIESENPTGSMKDRMALAMIEAAEADGRLQAGGQRSSNTPAAAPAFRWRWSARRSGYPLSIVTSDAFSAREAQPHGGPRRRAHDRARATAAAWTRQLTRDMIEAARRIAEETGAFWTDQLNNADQLAAYHAMAEEIWTQTDGRIDAFVQSVGNGGLACAASREACAAATPDIRIVAVEPAESAVLSGGKSGVHKIEGIGAGFVVPLWHDGVADEIATVSTEEAMAMARRLAREDAPVRRHLDGRQPRRRD